MAGEGRMRAVVHERYDLIEQRRWPYLWILNETLANIRFDPVERVRFRRYPQPWCRAARQRVVDRLAAHTNMRAMSVRFPPRFA